jgi:hypothetical protein
MPVFNETYVNQPVHNICVIFQVAYFTRKHKLAKFKVDWETKGFVPTKEEKAEAK